MDIDQVVSILINQGVKHVWFYPTVNSTGAKLFQLLNASGDELAWRWGSDGHKRWRIQMSLLPPHTVRPVDAVKYNISEGYFQLGIIDAANGTAPPVRPSWCR